MPPGKSTDSSEPSSAHPYVDLPKAVRVDRSIARSADGNDCYGALEFLKTRFEQRREDLDDELVEASLGVAKRTRSRSIAVGALNFLVETGVISGWEALGRIDEWKERNQPGG